MKALERKLFRDLSRLRGQVITIALVVAAGIASLLSMVTTYTSLIRSRDAYYQSSHFADVFAHVQRAPDRVVDALRQIPGVATAETRVTDVERVEVPGDPELVRGQFVSVSPRQTLNLVYLRSGRMPQRNDEAVVSELFAKAHDLKPGDTVTALLEGRRTTIHLTGVGTSPEYVWILPQNSMIQDDVRYGVFWIPREGLERALKLQDQFNDVVIALSPGASEAAVIDAVDRVLAPWGSFGAVGRDKQPSNRLVNQELQNLKGTATLMPSIFLGVAAFLLNVLLARIVGTQREQIATLKAVGYPDRRLGLHYLQLAMIVVTLGAIIGIAGGAWAGSAFVRLYAKYFRFPVLEYHFDPRALAAGLVVSFAAAGIGAWASVRRVVRLEPAEAMNAQAPASYHPTLVERWRLDRFLPVSARMVVRDLERQPWRTVLSSVGIAFATAIVAVGNVALDSIGRVFDVQFERAERQQLTATFVQPLPEWVMDQIRTVPGVMRAEPRWSLPVRLHSGPVSRETQLEALPQDTELQRIIDTHERSVPIPERGLVLTRVLADRLQVHEGDKVQLEILEGEHQVRWVQVTRIVDSWFGTFAYMRRGALAQLLDRAPQVTEALLAVDAHQQDAVIRALRRFPNVAAVQVQSTIHAEAERQLGESFAVFQTVLVAFAAVIAVGVVYNNARIALELRSRDLATLRILGFERDEVSAILMGEQAVQLLIGVPLGIPLGWVLSKWVYSRTDPELYRLPIILTERTAATSAIVVLLAGLLSAFLVRRKANRLDLIGVLKARD